MTSAKHRDMNALFRRELIVPALIVPLTLFPQIATANQNCGPGLREVSEGRGLFHCEAVAWICRAEGPKGKWGRGWNNNLGAAERRALDECNMRAGGGCSLLPNQPCTRQRTAADSPDEGQTHPIEKEHEGHKEAPHRPKAKQAQLKSDPNGELRRFLATPINLRPTPMPLPQYGR
jgi:hypothetical protein